MSSRFKSFSNTLNKQQNKIQSYTKNPILKISKYLNLNTRKTTNKDTKQIHSVQSKGLKIKATERPTRFKSGMAQTGLPKGNISSSCVHHVLKYQNHIIGLTE